MSLLLLFGLFLIAAPGSHAFQWSGAFGDNAYVAACANSTANLPWSFTTKQGETVHSIHWYFHGQHPEKLIAAHTANNFFAVPEFSQRVQFLDNGGLIMSDLTPADSGKYSVQLTVSDAKNPVSSYARSAYLEVSDGLQVTQKREAVHNPKTDSMHVALKCGPIVRGGPRVADALWKTPSGDFRSWKFERGHFYFLLPNPVRGGKYSCSLPRGTQLKTCLPAGAKQKAWLVVDETKARFTLLEVTVNSIEDEVDRNTEVIEAVSHHVAFHVSQSKSRYIGVSNPVILDTLLLNDGDAFNKSSGSFIVPYSGTYFLIITAPNTDTSLLADTNPVCSVSYSSPKPNTCHATVRLMAGQRVWLRCGAHCRYDAHSTFFSGFLLHTDEQN